jgi:signal transduction histidine kinase
MLAVILASLAASQVMTDRGLKRIAETEVAGSLQGGRLAYERFEALRSKLLLDTAASVALTPYLKATLTIPDVDHETLLFTAKELQAVSHNELLLLLDTSGVLLADASDSGLHGQDLVEQPGVKAALWGGARTEYWEYRGQVFNVAIAPIRSQEVLGLLCIGSSLDTEVAALIRDVTGRDTLIIHRDALLAEAWETRETVPPVDVHSLAHLSEGNTSAWTLGGARRLATSIPLMEGCVLVLSRTVADVEAPFRAARSTLHWIGFLTALIAVVMSRLVASKLTKPLNELTKASARLGGGDFTASVSEQGNIEVSRLANSFNLMSRQIGELVQQVEAKSKAAQAASMAKSDFLANMSHELRTPLHGILSFSNFGVKRYESADREKLGDYFGHIRTSGSSLLVLLNAILDLAKCESGKMTYRMHRVDLRDLVQPVLDELKALLSERGIELSWRRPEWSAEVNADAEKIKQVIRNLLSNAIKFSPEHAAITLSLESRVRAVRLAVRDEGPGVPEDELDAVFDKFVQSSLTNDGSGGTGLGLAICSAIVDEHGGRIWAENNPPKGATFWIELARADAPEPAGVLAQGSSESTEGVDSETRP